MKGVFASRLDRRCYICHSPSSFESPERLPSMKYVPVLFQRSEDTRFFRWCMSYLSIGFMLVAMISISILTFRALMGSILDGTEYLISVSIPKTLVVHKHLGIFMPGNAGWSLSDQPQKHWCTYVLCSWQAGVQKNLCRCLYQPLHSSTFKNRFCASEVLLI